MANENDRPLGKLAEFFDKYFTSKADWSIPAMKTQARSYFLTNFISCLLVSMILGTATRWMCYIFTPRGGFFDENMWENFFKTRLIAAAIIGVIALFAFGPLEMSAKRFYLLNEQGQRPTFRELKFGFTNGKYWNTVLVMGVKNLVCTLGYLLASAGKDVLLAVLFIPLVFPLLYACVSATTVVIAGGDVGTIYVNSLLLAAGYDVVMLLLSWVLYDFVISA